MTVFQISVPSCFSWENDATVKMNVNLAKQKEFPNREGNQASKLLLKEDSKPPAETLFTPPEEERPWMACALVHLSFRQKCEYLLHARNSREQDQAPTDGFLL